MVVAPTVHQPRRMFDVQHFVIKDVLNEPLGYIARVERLTDGNGLVDPVMVTEDPARSPLRPGNRWFLQLALKVLPVKSRKHSIQIVHTPLSRRDHLTAPTSTRQIGG